MSRSGVTNAAVSVLYATTGGGTATNGLDFLSAGGQLNFAAGVITQSFLVPILDNTSFNADRTVQLALSSPTGDFGVKLGAVGTATLTINNDDTADIAGRIDSDFSPGFDGPVRALEIIRGTNFPGNIGKLYAVGDFTNITGVTRSRIARLNRDGGVDVGFTPAAADGAVHTIRVMTNCAAGRRFLQPIGREC